MHVFSIAAIPTCTGIPDEAGHAPCSALCFTPTFECLLLAQGQPTPEERFPWTNDEVQYRLVPVVNPEREFFKFVSSQSRSCIPHSSHGFIRDSGGKSHCLTTRLRLVPITESLNKKARSADVSMPDYNQSLAYECDDSIKVCAAVLSSQLTQTRTSERLRACHPSFSCR